MKADLSCMVITYNEENNIGRLLCSLHRFTDILVVDSGSTDKTIQIVSSFANVRIVSRPFDTFAQQCNFGLGLLEREWVLSLDADYIVTPELETELTRVLGSNSKSTPHTMDGYYIPFRYCINGKPIRSGLLPPRISLYRRRAALYVNVGHAHRVYIDGEVGRLSSYLLHDDRKSLWIWLKNQKKYQSIEACMLKNTPSSQLPLQDKVRKHTCIAPFLVFLVCIFVRGGLVEGKEGFIYAFQRLIAESLLFVELHSDIQPNDE